MIEAHIVRRSLISNQAFVLVRAFLVEAECDEAHIVKKKSQETILDSLEMMMAHLQIIL
jgi:hypothetical protein